MQTQNKDLPSNPLQFKSHLGQDIVLSGFTKHEAAALAILQTLLALDPSDTELVKKSYDIADQFCQYQPEQK